MLKITFAVLKINVVAQKIAVDIVVNLVTSPRWSRNLLDSLGIPKELPKFLKKSSEFLVNSLIPLCQNPHS